MIPSARLHVVRTIAVAGISVLLIVGGAFAANNLARSVATSSDTLVGAQSAEPTASPEASESAEPSESPDASNSPDPLAPVVVDGGVVANQDATDDHGSDATVPEISDDQGDEASESGQGIASPDTTDQHDANPDSGSPESEPHDTGD